MIRQLSTLSRCNSAGLPSIFTSWHSWLTPRRWSRAEWQMLSLASLGRFLSQSVDFDFECGERATQRFAKHPKMRIGELLGVMKLNYELSDFCSTWVDALGGDSSKIWLGLDLADQRFVTFSRPHGIGWPQCQGSQLPIFFCNGFNPQKRHGHTARNMSKEEFLSVATFRDVFHISWRPRHVNVKDNRGRLKDKREVMREIRTQRGCGPFVAKHFYRIYSNFKSSSLPAPSFSECGSGARSFLLLWKGYPQRLLSGINAQDASDFFNVLLKELGSELRTEFGRMLREVHDPGAREFLGATKIEMLQSLEAVQFICCGCSQLINRSSLYLMCPPMNAPQENDMDEDENQTSDVE